jgi:hypothetical protein
MSHYKSGGIAVLIYFHSQENLDADIKGKNGYTLLHIDCNKINILMLDIFTFLVEIHQHHVSQSIP